MTLIAQDWAVYRLCSPLSSPLIFKRAFTALSLQGQCCREAERVSPGMASSPGSWHFIGPLVQVTLPPWNLPFSFHNTLPLFIGYLYLLAASSRSPLLTHFPHPDLSRWEDFFFFLLSFPIPWLDYQLHADSQYYISSQLFSPELQTLSPYVLLLSPHRCIAGMSNSFSQEQLLISFSSTI